jgi:hypothetical protein
MLIRVPVGYRSSIRLQGGWNLKVILQRYDANSIIEAIVPEDQTKNLVGPASNIFLWPVMQK